ncbi:MAG: hypothetical protein MI975_14110 [Cytophagales bacterium]|nr:hypothetical protein [Cytophagales bacterium]
MNSKRKLAIFMLIIISVLIINSAGFASDMNWNLMHGNEFYEWWQYHMEGADYKVDLLVRTPDIYIGEWIFKGYSWHRSEKDFIIIDFWKVVYNGFDDKGNINLLVYWTKDKEKDLSRLYDEIEEYIEVTDADEFSKIFYVSYLWDNDYSKPNQITVDSSKTIYLINHHAIPPFKFKTSRDSSLISIIVKPF